MKWDYEKAVYVVGVMMSVNFIWAVILAGVLVNFRPGIPSISRLLADNHCSLQFVYYIFVVIFALLRAHVLARHDALALKHWLFHLSGLCQIIALVLIPLADLDYMFLTHLSMVFLLLLFTTTREVSSLYWFRANTSDGVNLLHLLILLSMLGTSGIYAVMELEPSIERTTSVALYEYTFVVLLAELSIFDLKIISPDVPLGVKNV